MAPTQHAVGPDELAWICSANLVPVETEAGPDAVAAVRSRDLGQVGLAHVGTTTSRLHRTAGVIARDGADDLLVAVNLSGSATLTDAGGAVLRHERTVLLLETGRPFTVEVAEHCEDLVVRVSRALLGVPAAVVRARSAIAPSADAPAVRTLRHHVGRLLSTPMTTAVAEDALRALPEILRLALDLGTARPRRAGGAALAAGARWTIAARAGEVGLTSELVAHAHGTSRRHLETAFAREAMTPAGYLRECRLHRARALLRTSAEPLPEIAHRSGHRSVDTLIRSFRRAYGVTPTEWRRTLVNTAPPVPGNRAPAAQIERLTLPTVLSHSGDQPD